MAMQDALEKAHRKPSPARAPRFPAVVCIAALLLICLYSAFAIHRLIASNAPPTVTFTLGTAHRDVTYCNSQTLDVYVPSSAATRPLPLAVFVHGAGLTAGDKGYLNPTFLNALARAGFAVASLNYRLAPGYRFPAQIEDVKCGIRYLRAHAPTYDLNPSKIFAFGTSYGGMLATLAALTGGHSNFDVGPYATASSAITAAVDMFGPADLPGWISPQSFHIAFASNRANLVLGFPLPAWRDPLKGEEFSDGRGTQEVRQGLQRGRGTAGPGDRQADRTCGPGSGHQLRDPGELGGR